MIIFDTSPRVIAIPRVFESEVLKLEFVCPW